MFSLINDYQVDKKLSNTSNKWGNGRDWKNAPPHEGKWVRIWPMNLGANYDATHTSDKAIVLEVHYASVIITIK